jgi:diguanylate cyclase (GGDEF)-like protein
MMVDQAKILVVDDELFFRHLYRDLLEDAGYTVVICASGDEAVRLLEAESFDLVLSDVVMPGRSGVDVLRFAKGLPSPPDVVMVTGYASLDSAIESLKNGARDYLVKPFNPEELKHLISTCLEQRRLLAENAHLKRQINLFQTGQTLSSLIDLECLIPQSLEALMRKLGSESGFSFTLAEDKATYLTGLKKIHAGDAEKLIDLLLPEFFQAAGVVQPSAHCQEGLRSLNKTPEQIWMLPLRDGDLLKGGLLISEALCDDPDFSPADLRYLCDQIALGFANASRYRNAQQLMYSDDLTGLYNHRYLQIALNQEMMRSQRYGLKFSVLFMDLDRFKEINDQHGHLAGSAALQEVGRLMRGCVRDVDTLFRFGGDEFAALLVETDQRAARVVAERIRGLIEKHVFLEKDNQPSQVTVSIGIATFPDDATNQERLLGLADQAMYAGKESRNSICSAVDIGDTR